MRLLAPLGVCWGVLGASCASWGLLRASWRFLRLLGPSWGLGPLGASWGPLRAVERLLAAVGGLEACGGLLKLLGLLGPLWGPLGALDVLVPCEGVDLIDAQEFALCVPRPWHICRRHQSYFLPRRADRSWLQNSFKNGIEFCNESFSAANSKTWPAELFQVRHWVGVWSGVFT